MHVLNSLKSLTLSALKTKRRRALILVLIVAVGVFAYMRLQTKTEKIQIETQIVEKGTIVSTISATGTVLSANSMDVTTSISGLVKEVFVKDGQEVKKGQKILEIEPDQASAQSAAQNYSAYLSAKNAVATAITNLYTLQSQSFAANQKFINDAVARDLATNDPTYIQQYADWKAAEEKYNQQVNIIDQAKVSLSSASLSLSSTSAVVTAPMSGVVENIGYVTGMVITGTDTSNRVAVIETHGFPIASFNASELDVSKIKIGMKATIAVDSLIDKTFTGKVVSVDKIGTTASNVTSYPVIVLFDTQVEGLIPNMSATANIITQTKQGVLLVPSTAVQSQSGQSIVRVMINGTEEARQVKTGISSDSQIEIVSGLNEGDTIITSSSFNSSSSSTTSTSPFGSNRTFGVGGFTSVRVEGGGAPR